VKTVTSGYEFVEKMKRTGPAGLGVRVKVPRHPVCRVNSDELYTAELVRISALGFQPHVRPHLSFTHVAGPTFTGLAYVYQ
jgi:hypothetical protein